ncbi:hypothetical protein C8Q77DRAFT_296399 [Trametes polyzona]|nr:hypothetical protein C8Q77DRAFT_296399 [Trametes polyzona]
MSAEEPDHEEPQYPWIPRWLRRHPELQRRGIVLGHPLKPDDVYRTPYGILPPIAVKSLQPDNGEADIYERLQRLRPSKRNHTIPFELVRGERDIVIMPCLESLGTQFISRWSLSKFLGDFLQVVEGVEFMHSNNIAHMDLCDGNVVVTWGIEARTHPLVQPDRIYIIDYGASRHFPLPPGAQPAVTLPETQVDPPHGITMLDPYSWDVYCLGHVLKAMAWDNYNGVEFESYPWTVRRITRWLIGDERGCVGVCHCRPTARTVRRVLTVVRWGLVISESFGKVFRRLMLWSSDRGLSRTIT